MTRTGEETERSVPTRERRNAMENEKGAMQKCNFLYGEDLSISGDIGSMGRRRRTSSISPGRGSPKATLRSFTWGKRRMTVLEP